MTQKEHFNLWWKTYGDLIVEDLSCRAPLEPDDPLDVTQIRLFLFSAYVQGWNGALDDHSES